MKNLITLIAKIVLIPLKLMAAVLVIITAIQKKYDGLGMNTQKISNEEHEDIIKTVKSLKRSDLLINGVSETIENEAKEQDDGFLSNLMAALGAILLGNLLAIKGVTQTGKGKIKPDQDFYCHFIL